MGTVMRIGVKDILPSADPAEELNELYIPSEAADKLGFGIVPGEVSLGVPGYKLGTERGGACNITKRSGSKPRSYRKSERHTRSESWLASWHIIHYKLRGAHDPVILLLDRPRTPACRISSHLDTATRRVRRLPQSSIRPRCRKGCKT